MASKPWLSLKRAIQSDWKTAIILIFTFIIQTSLTINIIVRQCSGWFGKHYGIIVYQVPRVYDLIYSGKEYINSRKSCHCSEQNRLNYYCSTSMRTNFVKDNSSKRKRFTHRFTNNVFLFSGDFLLHIQSCIANHRRLVRTTRMSENTSNWQCNLNIACQRPTIVMESSFCLVMWPTSRN